MRHTVAPVVGTPRQVVLLAKGVKGFAAEGYCLEGWFRTVETAAYNLIFFRWFCCLWDGS